ncbi:FliM/FliN family flagellar motor switch protein [Methylocucumis oryzae]|nr:FliM/FliN family flagellar motor switch protein [Methylocucumis oryzae]
MIPVEMPKTVKFNVAGIPVYEAKVGISHGNYAVEIVDKVKI